VAQAHVPGFAEGLESDGGLVRAPFKTAVTKPGMANTTPEMSKELNKDIA